MCPFYEMWYKDNKGMCPVCEIRGPQSDKKALKSPRLQFLCVRCTLPNAFLLWAGKKGQLLNEVLASQISTESSFFIAKVGWEKHLGGKL